VNMSAAHCQELSGKCQGISECLESGHPVTIQLSKLYVCEYVLGNKMMCNRIFFHLFVFGSKFDVFTIA